MSYPKVDTLNAYQHEAARFAKYREHQRLEYNAMKLASEAGEVCGKVAKFVGHGKNFNREDLALELGDLLWHLSMMARDFGYTLGDIANMNLNKLDGRDVRGTIVGDGDHR